MCNVKTQIAKIAHCKTTSVLRYSAIYAMHCNAILQNATGLVFSSASVEMGWASMAQPRWSPKLRFTLQFAPSLCMSPWFVLRYASVGYSLERNTRLLTDLTVWSWRMMHVQGKMQIPMVLSMLLYGFTNLGLWWAVMGWGIHLGGYDSQQEFCCCAHSPESSRRPNFEQLLHVSHLFSSCISAYCVDMNLLNLN